jgi:hypothetical protein
MFNVRALAFEIPPPFAELRFPLIVEFAMFAVLKFRRPPPSLLAVLLLTVESNIIRFPLFKMPPPDAPAFSLIETAVTFRYSRPLLEFRRRSEVRCRPGSSCPLDPPSFPNR